ncbi:MAG: LacI family transcriptional regulator [Prolixibacteraceae bacterium]|jgi:LacI family transcriptional regulator|nr:LacI family transcriptional regulator [Prolixibacteraceae bacterium]
MRKNIRIKDIALKAGVSIGTVDRVLHKRGEVSTETKARIQQIIDELDYRPNLLASSLASKKSIVFATLMPESYSLDTYWTKPQNGVEKAMSQLRAYGVKLKQYFFDMDDSRSFSLQGEKLLLDPPDAVMLAPWAKREALRFTKQLDELNIPYIYIDANLEETHPIGFVAQSPFDSGFLAAKLIDWGVKGKSLILLIHVAKELDNASHLIKRERGFMRYFEEMESNHRIVKLEVSGKEDEINSHLHDLDIDPCEVSGVFVTNSKVHLAATCFKALCVTPKIIGYDLIPQNINLLKEGKIDFLICQKPELQGYRAIHLLFDTLVKKEIIIKENYTSIDLITKENVDFYNSI